MNRRLALKTASYGVLHVLVATTIAYMLTGNAAAAAGIGLIEPIVQTGVFAIHERLWETAATKPDVGRPGVMARAARACCLRIDSLLTDDDTSRAHAA
jgi:uncharacterized membrane protein